MLSAGSAMMGSISGEQTKRLGTCSFLVLAAVCNIN